MGTTHADYFRGDIPVTRPMTEAEISEAYEKNTGLVIAETFTTNKISPEEVPAVLVANHAPFTWGRDGPHAIELARVLELVARLDFRARVMAPDAPRPDQFLIDKHYFRKHGKSAYYGQP
jgi:L-ribulose-5-phosphate 4-epimerase